MANERGQDRRWRGTGAGWLLLFWLLVAGYMLLDRWGAIRGFALGDTDDNMRMMQVRALLAGQGWYDLRQYRLNPPFGADIHWSRLVDLPIAAHQAAAGAAARRPLRPRRSRWRSRRCCRWSSRWRRWR